MNHHHIRQMLSKHALETTLPRKSVKRKKLTFGLLWKRFSILVTCCFFPSCLKVMGKRDTIIRQAWREKIALCLIIALLCCGMGFLTLGIQQVLCPERISTASPALNETTLTPLYTRHGVVIKGQEYSFYQLEKALLAVSKGGIKLTSDWHSRDLTPLFLEKYDHCSLYNLDNNCTVANPIFLTSPSLPGVNQSCPYSHLLSVVPKRNLFITWPQLDPQLQPWNKLVVYNSIVLNISNYFTKDGSFLGDELTMILSREIGKDITYATEYHSGLQEAIPCLQQRYKVAVIEKETIGCITNLVILYVTLFIVLAIVLTKCFMAAFYHWTLSHKFVKKFHTDMNVISLVTCYTESEKQIQSTLNSISNSNYPDSQKLIFVICDGLVYGKGNPMSTADIVLNLIDIKQESDCSLPYMSLEEGDKFINKAIIYSGFYHHNHHSVPSMVIVKVGNETELGDAKVGNRGKRDSQLILMNFLIRSLFRERFSELDYEIYKQLHTITKKVPEDYESILMLDSDTSIHPNAMQYMVNALRTDEQIMAVCGESRIANTFDTWVTAIQVYEYYISHHLGKAFEAVFGGVTCLPGCFSMYRIKVKKGSNTWVPILVNPDLVNAYSETKLNSLHQKNLLLLGEDRFLTTMLLKTFPKRKTMYIPQAKCDTIAPNTLRILFSQRRRWLNSTFHNLLELLTVRDLCGTFCFSMQFVVFLELLGTCVLPVSMAALVYLIMNAVFNSYVNIIPLMICASMLGLPAILIITTTTNYYYIFWLLIYIVSLPIWNFFLPIYSFWNFDNFEWGKTRTLADMNQRNGFITNKSVQLDVLFKSLQQWETDLVQNEAHFTIDVDKA